MDNKTDRAAFQAEFNKLGYQWSASNQAKAFLGWQLAQAAYPPKEAEPAPQVVQHDSDCSLHNAPALPIGPCDCSVSKPVQAEPCCVNWAAGTSCFADPKQDCPRLPPMGTAPALMEGPLPMDTAPKDGTMLRLLVQFENCSFDDSNLPCWVCGFNLADNTGEDKWQFPGWSWVHDYILDASDDGKPIGWLPMLATQQEAQPQGEVFARIEFRRGTPGKENDMPTVVSCNWLPDGVYEVYLADPTGVQPCCGEYAQCRRPCTPRGRWLAQAAPAGAEKEDAIEHLDALVTALSTAFISSWQSTASWSSQLREASRFLSAHYAARAAQQATKEQK